MAGNILSRYAAASTTLTTTNLQTLAASQTWIAGWGSNSVNNTSNNYSDYLYGGTFTTASGSRQAGTINIYVVGFLNDTPTIPAVSSGTLGTEGTIAFAEVNHRDSLCRLLASLPTDANASTIFAFPPTGIAQLFGGWVPMYHCLFIAANAATTTAANFASAAIYYTPTTYQYT